MDFKDRTQENCQKIYTGYRAVNRTSPCIIPISCWQNKANKCEKNILNFLHYF